MPHFTTLMPMRRDSERVPSGETIEMSAAEAKPLVGSGALAPSSRPAPPPPPLPPPPPPPPPPAAKPLPDEAALKAMTPTKLVAQGKVEGLELDKAAPIDGLVAAILTARKPAEGAVE